MTPKPVKPKIDEYTHTFGRNACTAALRLIVPEVRYVEETPGIRWWWEDVIISADHEQSDCPYKYLDKKFKGETHSRYCYPDFPDKSKKTVFCRLSSKHDGPHMSEIGICDEDLARDIWISWKAGEHGSRELIQPGMCHAEKTPGDSQFFCILAEGHSGEHQTNDEFVNGDWEPIP